MSKQQSSYVGSDQAQRGSRDLPPTVKRWSVPAEGDRVITYGDIHQIMSRDIALGNDYRKERIKHLTTLATGVFAITATFNENIFNTIDGHYHSYLMPLAWALLIFSLLCGIFHFRCWENFYLEHRATSIAVWERWVATTIDKQQDQTRAINEATGRFDSARCKIKQYQRQYRQWDIAQSASLLLGMACIAAHVAVTTASNNP